MQVYNTELYHFGIKGMKWGKGKSIVSYKDKKTAIKITKIALTIASRVALNKTNISPGKQAVLGLLAGELGGLAVGKALKMDNKELAKNTITKTTQVGITTASNKLLKDHTDLDPFKRMIVSNIVGGVGAGVLNKVIDKRKPQSK